MPALGEVPAGEPEGPIMLPPGSVEPPGTPEGPVIDVVALPPGTLPPIKEEPAGEPLGPMMEPVADGGMTP